MEILAEYGTILIVLAAIFGLYMTWGIGANDVANAMGTSVGSGAITVKQAIIIAAIFEFAGAFLAGGHVTKTIRKGIIDPSSIAGSPEILVFGMLAALLAAAVWLMVATHKGWPVSTTHSIVGAIVGFAVAGIGLQAVEWAMIGQIVRLHKQCKKDKIHLKLCSISPNIMEVFTLMRLNKLLEIYKNQAEALEAFGPPRRSWFARG